MLWAPLLHLWLPSSGWPVLTEVSVVLVLPVSHLHTCGCADQGECGPCVLPVSAPHLCL